MSRVAIGSIFIALFVTVSANAATPFHEKFERQKTQQGHVFKPGEIVESVFTPSICEGLLSLTVSQSRGGVGDIRHADTFQLLGLSEQDRAKLKDWGGMSMIGKVEIVEPIDRGYVISNMYDYRAKLVQIEAPTARINPTPKHIQSAKEGEEMFIIGQVTRLTEKEVTITTPAREYRITLWSGIPVIESDVSRQIKNLTGNERMQLGDEVRLLVYRAKEGGIAAHWCRSCYLENPSPDRKAQYLAERQKASHLIAQFKVSIDNNYFQAARKFHAELMRLDLTPAEIVRHKKLWLKLPVDQQPILLPNRNRLTRTYPATILKALKVDIEELTLKEFLAFVDSWSKRKVYREGVKGQESLDESYLFRVLDDLTQDPALVAKVARQGVESYLQYFMDRSARGLTYDHKLDWNARYNLERFITYSTYEVDAETIIFLVEKLKVVARLETAGWGYADEYLRPIISALEDAVSIARKGETVAHKDAHAELMLRKDELVQVYRLLEGVPNDGPLGDVTVIGMPTPKKPSPRQQNSAFAYELRDLAGIIENL